MSKSKCFWELQQTLHLNRMKEMTDVLTDVIFTCQRLHMGEKSEAHDCTVSSKNSHSLRGALNVAKPDLAQKVLLFFIFFPPTVLFSACSIPLGVRDRSRAKTERCTKLAFPTQTIPPSYHRASRKAKDKQRDPLNSKVAFFGPTSVFLMTKQAQELNRNITNTAWSVTVWLLLLCFFFFLTNQVIAFPLEKKAQSAAKTFFPTTADRSELLTKQIIRCLFNDVTLYSRVKKNNNRTKQNRTKKKQKQCHGGMRLI